MFRYSGPWHCVRILQRICQPPFPTCVLCCCGVAGKCGRGKTGGLARLDEPSNVYPLRLRSGRLDQVADQALRIEGLFVLLFQLVPQLDGLRLGHVGLDHIAGQVTPRLDCHLDNSERFHDFLLCSLANGNLVVELFALLAGILGTPVPTVAHDLGRRSGHLAHLGRTDLDGEDGAHCFLLAPLTFDCWRMGGRLAWPLHSAIPVPYPHTKGIDPRESPPLSPGSRSCQVTLTMRPPLRVTRAYQVCARPCGPSTLTSPSVGGVPPRPGLKTPTMWPLATASLRSFLVL